MEQEQALGGADQHSHWDTRLRGRWLLLARAGWVVIVGLTILLYIVSRPISFTQNSTVCTTPPCGPSQLTPADAQRLQQQGLSVQELAAYYAATDVLFELVFVAVALIIFWRKSDDWMALLVGLMLVTFSIATFSDSLDTITATYPSLAAIPGVISQVGTLSLFLFFFLFPDGRFAPPWTRWLFLLIIGLGIVGAFFPDSPLGGNGLGALIGFGSILFVQIYRYMRVSGTEQRQQTKWVVFGATAAFGGFAALLLLLNLLGVNPEGSRTPSAVLSMVVNAAFRISLALIPLSLLVAILRYRLWEIDLIINRTLVYVPLTAILAGIFSASITLSQKFFVTLTGQTSDAATVLTTLIVVAAFEPVKTGLQHLVDRRFKYPEKRFGTLAGQVNSVLQVVDPQELAERLLADAVSTFEARGGAVFLTKDGEEKLVQSLGKWDGDAKLRVPLKPAADKRAVGSLALGPRGNGSTYSADDRKSIEEIGALVARAITLSDGWSGRQG